MKRKSPSKLLVDDTEAFLMCVPCSALAIACATRDSIPNTCFYKVENNTQDYPKVKANGYATLLDMNRSVRNLFKINSYKYVKGRDRKLLKEYNFKNKAVIVCVRGHYIYVNNDTYYSYYDNENGEVIAIWEIGGFK